MPTSEEVTRVKKIFQGNNKVSIKKGFSDNLPFNKASVDLILCNSVFHGVGFDSIKVESSIREFKRILKENAVLYIGEIPEFDEFSNVGYGNSLLEHLLYSFKKYGILGLLRNLVRVSKALLTDYVLIIQPKRTFYEERKSFVERLKKYGFKLISIKNSDSNKDEGIGSNPKTCRLDYIFLNTNFQK